ncbi:glycosyltransferase family 2 protein [Gaetbulibacter saemankumensis]|uniref:glycosyltransferase family 2 protein n=1 Tax=Gaetbulibacter saemankumensis TaxID=311208 RepID=UPI001FDEA4CA|nr:glycosyltransferase family A protein [Gaetbulibacter saemankumensis]
MSYLFPKLETLSPDVLAKLKPDIGYKTEQAKAYDMSWQAIQKGYIGDGVCYSAFERLPVIDEYRFIRTYFNKVWVFYVFILRLLTLHNPVKEWGGWYKTREVKRFDVCSNPLDYHQWDVFDSKLLHRKPLVTVVIPTLNRYDYLKDVLIDLERQDYTNFEVIVIDQSTPFEASFYKDFSLDIHVEYQEEKALWLARNKAIKQAKGTYILLFDDDSRVEADWIRNHLKCLDFFDAQISSGVSLSLVGAEIPGHYSYFKVSDQIDTGNVLIKRGVFNALGLFDRQFEGQRMGDGEFGLRCYLAGYKNISNPYAKRLHLKVGTGGLREMGSWDAFRPKKWLAPRPIPSVLYFYRRYFGNTAARYALLRTVPLSILPYRFKRNKPLLVLGGVLTLFFLPVVCYQVFWSWYLSTKKLKTGPLIERL